MERTIPNPRTQVEVNGEFIDVKDGKFEPIKEPNEGKVHYKKIGGGTFRLANGKIIKPNQRFWAFPEQIPEGVSHVVIPVDPDEPTQKVTPMETTFSIQTGSPGWYNVVDQNGKQINEKQLRQKDAEALVASLAE